MIKSRKCKLRTLLKAGLTLRDKERRKNKKKKIERKEMTRDRLFKINYLYYIEISYNKLMMDSK